MNVSTSTHELIVQLTKKWIDFFIIRYNICPFAKREIKKGTVRFEVCLSNKSKEVMQTLSSELKLLDKNSKIETTFLVYPQLFGDFYDYLDFVDQAEEFIQQNGYEGIYQLASFHPQYCFADVEFDDLTNLTNRSPYPMLHILREESLEKAIDRFGDTTQIYQNNITLLKQLSPDEIKELKNRLFFESGDLI